VGSPKGTPSEESHSLRKTKKGTVGSPKGTPSAKGIPSEGGIPLSPLE
jgi:hypothetical protein